MKIARLQKVMPATVRPFDIIRTELSERGIVLGRCLDRAILNNLSGYSRVQYRGVLSILDAAQKIAFFDKIKVPSASALKDIRDADFSKMAAAPQFIKQLFSGRTLDLRGLALEWLMFKKDRGEEIAKEPVKMLPGGQISETTASPKINTLPAVPKASDFLTGDLMFNPHAPCPESPRVYREMIRKITSERGIFPGDHDAPPPGYIVHPGLKGVKTYTLVRKGNVFTAQFFNPSEHALGIKNHLVFLFDLTTQMATWGAYGIRGCTYDRLAYCERRYFASDTVGIILFEGMPVSFAAVTQFETLVNDHPLKYVFIHVVMTVNGINDLSFQRMGLTSYLIREIGSSLFYQNAWRNEGKNPHLSENGDLVNERFRVWAAAHSIRASVYHAFSTSFQMAPPEMKEPDIVRRAVAESADQKITGDRHGRVLRPVSADVFRDEGIYPPHNRYPTGADGKVIIPDTERRLSTYPRWYSLAGGDEGLRNGDSLYIVGEITFDKIRAAKKREKQREGGGIFERAGDWVRGQAVKFSGG
jgi:hypothetical protein